MLPHPAKSATRPSRQLNAPHSQQLQQLFETHPEETEAQIERLEECFGLLDIQLRAKGCKA
jgi:Mn-containing catalase